MGGEELVTAFTRYSRWGSPPHGRGKGLQVGQQVIDVGITPAWAGKRCLDTGWCGCSRDHPRVGGEKFHSAAEIDEKMGSPPHRRGKVIVNLILTKGHRITPAQAGKGQE